MLLDDVLDLLSNEYRRNIMYFMTEEDRNEFTYNEITQALVDSDYLDGEDQERFGIQMEHIHLGKMEESGLIDREEETETIRYLPREEVEDLVDTIKEYEGSRF